MISLLKVIHDLLENRKWRRAVEAGRKKIEIKTKLERLEKFLKILFVTPKFDFK